MAKPNPSFPADRYTTLGTIDRNHFWFVARRELVRWLVREFAPDDMSLLVDAGCGSGLNLSWLSGFGGTVLGADIWAGRGSALHGGALHGKLTRADVTRMPLADASADAVMALDVLEHVDDHAAARELHRILKPQGVLLVTVPAFSWLWSFRDDDAGHLRRYKLGEISELLRGAGFELLYSSYYQFSLFPLLVLSRLSSRLLRQKGKRLRDFEDTPPTVLHAGLTRINLAEVTWLRANRRRRLPWGSSIVLVARKVAPDRS